MSKLPNYASNVSRVKRVEMEGHDLLEQDPCFVAQTIASFAWEVDNGVSGNPFAFPDSSKPENVGGVLTKQTISDANAVCADGSGAVYYKAASTSGTKDWLVFFEGAGEARPMACTTPVECAAWLALNPHLSGSATAQGALAFPTTLPGSGILSQATCENPSFASYNLVYVPYCSGDAWQADAAASLATGGAHLRGDRIFKAVLATVLADSDLTTSSKLVVAGEGAGAVAVSSHQA